MIIVFSGYNQRAVVAFLRTLEKNKVSDYGIIAASEKDTILLTAYASKIIYVRNQKILVLEEILSVIKNVYQQSNEKNLLIPSTEALNRFFLHNREELEKANCIVPLVDCSMYELISDKEAFWRYCLNKRLCVPQIVECKQENIPFVAKPKQYCNRDGNVHAPIIIKTEDEYKDFVTNYDESEFMCQEYVWGESFYLLFYFEQKGVVHKFSQVNYVQQPAGKSIVVAACSDLHLSEDVAGPYEAMFKEMGYCGFVMVELRHRDGRYYMIEANPRFWGPSQLFCNAGYNLFEVFLKEYGYISSYSLENVDYDAKYLWSGGIIGDLLENKECVWYGNGREEVRRYMEKYLLSDIYRDEDTIDIYEKEKSDNELVESLIELYMRESKHSNYQILTPRLQSILGSELVIQSRYEKERMQYILEHVEIEGKKILDIGGNTGFFTFESCENKALQVDYYEGNENHAEFVDVARKVLGLADKITVYPEYYLFEQGNKKYDITYCLNVVHHLGDDFAEETNISKAKERMIKSINQLAKISDILIFQMGYNWGGNPETCLFDCGTKEEMEQFIEKETAEYWDILNIAVPEKKDDRVIYCEVTKENNIRNDALGEFLNRPLFIMKSKVFSEK